MAIVYGRHRKNGFVPLEILAVIAVMAVLLGLGVIVVRGARQQAHLTEAESRLKQVSVALDLYFKKYGRYPASGKNLAKELEEFIGNQEVFSNPLKDETMPGETISSMYHEPTTQGIDEPETYVTALIAEDGKTAVILKTNGKVVTTNKVTYDPKDDPEFNTEAKINVMTLAEEQKGTNGDDDGLHPILAIFTKYNLKILSGNRGHGNNIDHDDYDNQGVGDGGHGTADGFVPDANETFDWDELKGRAFTIKDSPGIFGIANITKAPHDAIGVSAEVTIMNGAQYLKSLDYVGEIGDIPAGESRPLILTFDVDPDWAKAGPDAYIHFRITITAEGNDPDVNVGKKVDVLLVK